MSHQKDGESNGNAKAEEEEKEETNDKLKKNVDEHTNITELLKKFECLSGTTSLLQIAMQEEISSVIGTSNSTCGHSNLSDFFKNVLRHTEALKSIISKQSM